MARLSRVGDLFFRMPGEDENYRRIDAANGCATIQICRWSCPDEVCFEDWAAETQSRCATFARENLPDAPETLLLDAAPDTAAAHEAFQATHVMRVWLDEASRAVVVAFNHARVGGGDFLGCAAAVSGGRAISLPAEVGLLGGIAALARTVAYLPFSPFLGTDGRPRGTILTTDGARVLHALKVPSRGECAGTKYVLIHSILEDVAAGYPAEVTKLTCWLPIAFERTVHSPKNNVGIIPFVYARGQTAAQVAASVKANAFVAVGSNTFLRFAHGFMSHKPTEAVKKRVDVVISLSKVDAAQSAPKQMSVGFLRQNRLFHYPVYVMGLTLNGTSHVTYNVVDPLCDTTAILTRAQGSMRQLLDPFLTKPM